MKAVSARAWPDVYWKLDMSEINAKELRKLYDNFDTQDILRAIDMLDSARCHLADQWTIPKKPDGR